MIRLVAYDSNGTPTILDTIGSENIALTLNVDDVRDIENKNASYSKDFELPATKHNNKFFNHIYDLQVDSNYNPQISSRIELYNDSVLLFGGGMYLNEVIDKDEERYYNVTLFAEPIQLIDRLEGKLLKEIDFSVLNHAYNYTNIENSWTTGVTLTAGGTSTDVFYPLVDTGTVSPNAFANYLGIEAHTAYTPFVSIKFILDKIFAGAGFSYVSSFFNSSFFGSLYMDTNAGVQLSNFNTNPASVTLDTDEVETQTLTTTIADLQLDEEYTDTDNLFNTATYSFEATEANQIVEVIGEIPLFGTVGEEAKLYKSVTVNGVTTDTFIGSHIIVQSPNSSNVNDIGSISISFTETLQVIGDSIKFKVKKSGLVGGSVLKVRSDAQTIYDYSVSPPTAVGSIKFSIIFQAFSLGELDSRIGLGRGTVKQVDFLRDIFKMFNLIVEPTENPTRLKIEPYEEYISTGVTHDWTNKVNIKEVKHEYIDVPRELLIAYNNDDDDLLLKTYEEMVGIPYGSHKIYLESERGGSKEIKLDLFSATVVASEGLGFASQIYKEGENNFNEPLDCAPRIVVKPASSVPVSVTDSILGINDTEYYTATHYQKNLQNLATTDQDINFGFVADIFVNQTFTKPVETLYQKYWYRYINNRYSEDTVILKCKANLTYTDIANFSFADTVIIENVKYYVNKIEYNTDDNALATVELLKQLF